MSAKKPDVSRRVPLIVIVVSCVVILGCGIAAAVLVGNRQAAEPTSSSQDDAPAGSEATPDADATDGAATTDGSDDADDISAETPEPAAPQVTTYTLPALTGPTSGSDGMVEPGAETGHVPALAVDLPEGWTVQNENINTDNPNASPYASVDFVNTETGAVLTLSSKVGANGGASSGEESVEVLGQTGIDGVEVVHVSGGGSGWSYQRLRLRDANNPMGEYVYLDGGSIQLQLTNPSVPPDSSSELFQQMVAIMCSLRVAE
ncbi:hypothetical protein [Thermophilibacter sp.]